MDGPRTLVATLMRRPYLLLSLTTLGWGGNAVAGRLAVGHVSPMAIVMLRWLVVMIVLGLFLGRSVRAEWPTISARWPYLFCMGALGFTAFNALFYWAAHDTTAVNIGVIQGLTPALVMAFAFLFYRTPIGALQAAGLLVTLLGVAVTASRGSWDVLRTFAFNAGDLGILLATVLYAGYTVGLRSRPALPPLVFFTAMAGAAFLTSLPLVTAEIGRGLVLWPDATGWALILYIGLVPSLLCQLSYMRAVELIGPSRAGLFMNLVPVTAALLAVVILGEIFATYHAVALVFVLGGIWLAERQRRAA